MRVTFASGWTPEAKVTLIHSRQQLLSSEDLPDEFKEKTLEMLKVGLDHLDLGGDLDTNSTCDKLISITQVQEENVTYSATAALL
jgi:hypothetical protein